MAARGTHGFRFALSAAGLAALLVSRTPLTVRLSADQAPVATPATPALSIEQQEEFLKKAKVLRTRAVGKGVTGTLRATLTDGTLTHDASIQTIDESMREFRSNHGTELNFVDSWRYNVAAYRLDRLLEIDMTPPSVERTHHEQARLVHLVGGRRADGRRRAVEGQGHRAQRAGVERADVDRAGLRSADLQRRSQPRQPGDRQAVARVDDRSLTRVPPLRQGQDPRQPDEDATGACSNGSRRSMPARSRRRWASISPAPSRSRCSIDATKS